MSDEKALGRALSVVQTLYKRTQAGRINWEVSFGYPEAFQADFGDIVVVIQEVDDPEFPDQPDYKVLVIERPIGTPIGGNPSSAGRVVDEISNSTLKPVMDQTTEDGLNPYNVLHGTFQMARRKALKVDAVLDNLLQKLDEG